MQSRRCFLRQSTLAAGASVIGAARRNWSASLPSAIDPASIESFRSKLNGRLILPADADCDAARSVVARNPENDKRPALIAQSGSEQDILRSIDFAHKHDLEVAVRSGNHSFLGWGTCNGGMVIDLSLMKGVTVDPADASRCMPWVEETSDLLQPHSGGRTYANYRTLTGSNTARGASGPNYERLATIKKKYDSENFFHLNANIAPA